MKILLMIKDEQTDRRSSYPPKGYFFTLYWYGRPKTKRKFTFNYNGRQISLNSICVMFSLF